MKKSFNRLALVLAFALMMALYACGPAGVNEPGDEYMPDMGHSIAYEANYYDYYPYNRWGSAEEYYEMAKPRKPVMGTIPRGAAGHAVSDNMNAIKVPPNGSVPYYYADTEAERTRAMNEITTNPFPITAAGLAVGKDLYDINCGICHGDKADGNGWLVDEKNPNPAYPAQPALLNNDEFTAASEGRFYHAIMHGKNVMGGYADKLSYEERWQVIHYIRSIQAKDRKLVYSETANTLNNAATPGASMPHKMAKAVKLSVPMLAGGHGAHDSGHDAGHDNHDGHDHGTEKHDAGHDNHDGHDHDSHDGHDHDKNDGHH